MIKHFCDICGKELIENDTISDVTLLTDLHCAQFYTFPEYKQNCEICVSCAQIIIDTIKMMKKGRGVIYVEKK